MNREYIEARSEDVLDLVLLLLVVAAYEVIANVVFAVMLAVRIGSLNGMMEFIWRMAGWPPLLVSVGAGGWSSILAIAGSYIIALAVVSAVILLGGSR